MKNCLLLLGLLFMSCSGFAQRVQLKASANTVLISGTNGDENIHCLISNSVYRKGIKNAKLFLFAKNNLSNIPMVLKYNNSYLPLPAKAARANKGYYSILTASFHDIFFPHQGSFYTWQWRGRAEAPLSPIFGPGEEKVSEISCWFVYETETASYTSDTLRLRVAL